MAELKEVGAEVVAFVSVNDAFVMDAWGKLSTEQDGTHQVRVPSAQDAGIRMLADPEGHLMRAMGMAMTKVVGVLGNERAYRYSLVASGGVITDFQLDEQGIKATAAENLLKVLQA